MEANLENKVKYVLTVISASGKMIKNATDHSPDVLVSAFKALRHLMLGACHLGLQNQRESGFKILVVLQSIRLRRPKLSHSDAEDMKSFLSQGGQSSQIS